MIWVGLDLHKRYITACALDTAGTVVAESSTRRTSFTNGPLDCCLIPPNNLDPSSDLDHPTRPDTGPGPRMSHPT